MKKRDREMAVQVLFKESRGTKSDFSTLARLTGIPVDTLRRYKRMPEKIPLDRLLLIVRETGATAEEVGRMITGRAG